jgi:putative ubiquitin-RnfH superfamily antitoxin RatB of RatAB toxin-antitoxin module
MNAGLFIEVVYAHALEQDCCALELQPGARVRDAIERSGILERHPEIDLHNQTIGIWNRRVGLDEPLRDRDRVEIYRPLTADPKEVRRRRAEAAKKR